MIILNKVISGGQTGADIAGLKAAKECNIITGGYLPKGCRTLDGPKPEYILEYNMIEHSSSNYALRTESNVKNSDGTIRFATNFKSAGEKCTLNAINWYSRPYLDIATIKLLEVSVVLEWLEKNKIQTLNIAGNSEQTSPGIELIVYNYLCKVFKSI